jgi:hypothetical protein
VNDYNELFTLLSLFDKGMTRKSSWIFNFNLRVIKEKFFEFLLLLLDAEKSFEIEV